MRHIGGVANIAFLADLYHLGRMGEPLDRLVGACAHRLGHVQIADSPGRGRPGSGDLPYGAVLDRLAAEGYGGYVGLEYQPGGPGVDDFDWLPRSRRSTSVEESV